MAEEINREVIINVTVDSTEAIRNIAEAKKQIDELKEKNKELAKSQDDESDAIARNAEQIKALNKVVAANSKEVQTNIARHKQQEGSLKQMRASLRSLLDQYDSLSKVQREGAGGKEMLKNIQDLTEELRVAEGQSGRFQINVGNYPGIFGKTGNAIGSLANKIQTLTGGATNISAVLKNAATAAGSFGKQLLKLLANPIVAIFAAIALVVTKVVDAFKRNDDASTKLQQAFSAFQPIITALNKVFSALANTVATVVGWMTKAATAVLNLIPAYREAAKEADNLVIAQDKLEDAERNYTVNHAEREKEIARLRDDVADKEKYNVQQRRERLAEAQRLARKDMEEAKKIAEERLRIEIANNKKNDDLSDEAKNREAKLRADLINIEKEYYQQSRALTREMQRFNNEAAAEEAARIKKQQEDAKRAAEAARERRQKELAERRIVEDITLALLAEGQKKQEALLRTEFARRIEDIKNRLKTESNLTKKAREALNQQIVLLEAQLQVKLGEINEQFEIENFNKIKDYYSRRLELAKDNIEMTLNLQIQQLEIERQQALTEAAKKGEDVALVNAIFDKRINDARLEADKKTKDVLKQRAVNAANEEKNRLERALMDMGADELGKLKLQQDYAQRRLATLEAEYDAVSALTEKQAIEQYGSIEFWKSAQIEADAQVIEANKQVMESSAAVMAQQQQQSMSIANAFSSTGQSIQGVFDTLAETDERYSDFATGMALANIITSSAISIAAAIQAATQAGAFTGVAAPATIPVFIAELVGIVASGIASAVSTLQKARQARSEAKYAEGGYVDGPGTSTSDSIPARLSAGEFVVNAKGTRENLPLLVAINGGWGNTGGRKFAAGGVVGVDTMLADARSENLTAAIRAAVAEVQPVVSVKEITRVAHRVEVKENISKY